MANDTPAQKKLVSFLKKRDPNLSEKEIPQILNSIKRFVNLTKKIYTEPQAKVTYKDKLVKGKTVKDRIFTTDIEELTKVMEPSDIIIDIEVLRKLHKSVTKKQK